VKRVELKINSNKKIKGDSSQKATHQVETDRTRYPTRLRDRMNHHNPLKQGERYHSNLWAVQWDWAREGWTS